MAWRSCQADVSVFSFLLPQNRQLFCFFLQKCYQYSNLLYNENKIIVCYKEVFSTMSLSQFLALLHHPHIISFESSRRRHTVGPVSFWRAQQKMEEAAGLVQPADKIMVPWYFCDLCMIGIGPDHEHQRIYLYPAYREQAGPRGERKRKIATDMFCICESCASWRERDLPEWLCVLGPWAWESDALIKEDDQEAVPVDPYDGKLRARLRLQASKHIENCGWYIIYLMAIAFNIPLGILFEAIPHIIAEEALPAPSPLMQQRRVDKRWLKDPGIVFHRA